jgi:hypothetical protein
LSRFWATERIPQLALFFRRFHGEAMKIIGAVLLMLSLASAGMAVSMTLATAHPQAIAQR